MAKVRTIPVSQVIDASSGAYSAGDVVSADDTCATLAIPWKFDTKKQGSTWKIKEAHLFNETENQPVQYDLILFNTTPTGELKDAEANTNPIKADRLLWLGTIPFPFSIARGATVATVTQATPSTSGRLPMTVKTLDSDTFIYGVLVTNTAYTQTATDDITITLELEELVTVTHPA
ncbi:hypothetical protein LCGC14_1202420 [marine sediment metagenome]|uniref:Uncharacterized protein n=1 Tax=marine sediment metagenome TaxID=412755 RepID=A0A0F9LGH3_9ZZZZ